MGEGETGTGEESLRRRIVRAHPSRGTKARRMGHPSRIRVNPQALLLREKDKIKPAPLEELRVRHPAMRFRLRDGATALLLFDRYAGERPSRFWPGQCKSGGASGTAGRGKLESGSTEARTWEQSRDRAAQGERRWCPRSRQ